MTRPKIRAWLPIAAGVLAGAVVLIYVRGAGVELTPDSISYLAAADHLAAGDGPRDFQGDPLILWPPLYPAVLAALSPVAGGVVAAGALVNALAHGLSTFLVVLWWRRLGVTTTLLGAGGVVLAFNRVTLHANGNLWSEPLYGALALAAVGVVALPDRPATVRRAVVAGVLAGAAWLTKYLGASVAIAVGAVLFMTIPRRRAWLPVAAAMVIAAVPIGVWLARNLAACGTLTGPRLPGPGFSPAMVVESWRMLSRVFLSGVLAAPLVAALIAAGLWATARRQSPAWQTSEERAGRRRAASAVAVLLVAHVALLIWSVSTVAMDGIGRRFLAPAVAPAVFLVVLLLDRQRLRPRVAGLVPALGVLLAIYPAISGLTMVRQGRPASDGDRPAPALALPGGGPWFSNDPLQVYRWYRHPVRHAPAWQRHPTVAFHPTPDRWTTLLRDGGGEGWFLWVGPPDSTALESMQAIPGIAWRKVAAGSDLTVYRLRVH